MAKLKKKIIPEFDNEKKIPAIPPSPSHNFSNGPSLSYRGLSEQYVIIWSSIVYDPKNKNIVITGTLSVASAPKVLILARENELSY